MSAEKSKTYAYNAANELVSDSGVVYTYDRNGNTIAKSDGTTYAYDYENRLTKVTKADGTVVEFKYDVFGRRIEKKITPSPLGGEGGGEGVTRYFYDNEDILVEYDGAGNAGNKYTHGPGIDEPLGLTNDKGNYYYHADGLGSIVAITDKAQTVVQDYQYDWYGNLKDLKNRIKQPYAYTGREFDRETGLYFYRARYYDATVGRFITRDPIGFRGGMNLYAYVKANPSNWIDPFGFAPGDRYRTQHEAAYNALQDIYTLSVSLNREYGGMIYKNPDGTYSYTTPNIGSATSKSVNPGGPAACPKGTVPTAYYHTHGDDDRQHLEEGFSGSCNSTYPGDICYADTYKIDGYLATPYGAMMYYNYTNQVVYDDIGYVQDKSISGVWQTILYVFGFRMDKH